jgi:predicted nucleotidyltransferase
MKLKIIFQIRNKLDFLIKDKEIIDVILFGSIIKGKLMPKDIDIAIIINEELSKKLKEKIKNLNNFHISIINLREFFINPPSIINTLFREGYSIKNKRYFSENFKFSNKVLFNYSLTSLTNSKKVKIVNILRGKGKENGLVEINNGEWLANQVFIVPISIDSLFEEFFNNFNVKFKRHYILMH